MCVCVCVQGDVAILKVRKGVTRLKEKTHANSEGSTYRRHVSEGKVACGYTEAT